MLGTKIFGSEKLRRQSLGLAGLSDGNDSLKTVLRIRPTSGIDDFEDEYIEIKPETNEILFKAPKERGGDTGSYDKYKFDNIFGPEVQQKEVFNATAEELVQAAFEGKNACLFTYGASGSGKTHTIMGGESADSRGVLPRSMETMFSVIGDSIDSGEQMYPFGSTGCRPATSQEKKAQLKLTEELESVVKDKGFRSGEKRRSIMALPDNLMSDAQLLRQSSAKSMPVSDGHTYVAFASFYELYNEKIYDLLEKPKKDGKRKELTLKQDKKGTFIDKIRHIQVNKPSDAYRVLEAGKRNLSVGQTRLNKDSSRSHCLFTIRICKRISDVSWQVSSLAFCDLAGTERAKKMGQVSSKRVAESKTINQSLMQLRITIAELQKQQKGAKNRVVAGFRNSKLTRLMQTYLVGYAKTSIIVAVSNDPKQFEETQNSLKFASTAQAVQLGRDRHGHAMKEGDKLNISYNPKKIQEESEDSDNGWDSSDNAPDYKTFTKQELIDDLKYYIDREEQLCSTVMTMKVEWQKDEARQKEFELYHQEAKKDWVIDLQNARITAHNDREQSEYDWQCKMEKKNAKIKELRVRLTEGGPGASASQQIQEMSDQQAVLSGKVAQLEFDLKEKVDLAKQLATELDAAKKETSAFQNRIGTSEDEIITLKSGIEQMHLQLQTKDDEMEEVQTNAKHLRKTFDEKFNQLTEENEALKEELETKTSLSPIGSPTGRSSMVPSAMGMDDTGAFITREPLGSPPAQEDLVQQIEGLTEERDELSEELTHGKAMYKDLKKQNKSLTESSSQLEERLRIYEADINEKNEQIDGLNAAAEKAENEIAELKASVQATSNEIVHLKKQVADISAEANAHETEAKSLVGEINALKLDTVDLKDLLQSKEDLVVSLEAEISTLRSSTDSSDQIADLQGKLKEMETQSNEYEEQCVSNMSELDHLTKKLHEKNTELEKTKSALATMEENLTEKDQELLEIQTQLGLQESELALKQHNMSVLKAEVATKSGELDDRRKSRRIADGEKDRRIQELTEQVNSISIQPASNQPDVDVEELENKIRRLEADIEEKNKKYDRSILRKQKEKAIKENEELREKIQGLESTLMMKENQLRQTQIAHSEAESIAIESLSSFGRSGSSTIKEEPVDPSVLAPLPTNPVVKPEPEDEYVPPKNATPVRNVVNKLFGKKDTKSSRRGRKLAPSSPDPISNTPSTEDLPAQRTLRSRRKK